MLSSVNASVSVQVAVLIVVVLEGDKMKQLVGVLASLLFVVGCASDRVIVDTKGIDERKYQADLAECEAFAEQINTPAEAAKGGAVGAVIGATVGAVIGDSRTAERGAAILGAPVEGYSNLGVWDN